MKLPFTTVKSIAIMLVIIALGFDAIAQYHRGGSKEIGYQLGTTYYIGDLT